MKNKIYNILFKEDEILYYDNNIEPNKLYNILIHDLIYNYKNEWFKNIKKYSYVLNITNKIYKTYIKDKIKFEYTIIPDIKDFSYLFIKNTKENLIYAYLKYKNTAPVPNNFIKIFSNDLDKIKLLLYDLPYEVKEIY